MARKQKREEVKAPSFEQNQKQVDRLSKLATKISGLGRWSSASATLEQVRSVPTIFPQVDFALRTGGWPVDRIGVIHGASNEGKTLFLLGLGKSFLARGHFFAFVDAELTTPITWVRQLMGELADRPSFMVHRPTTFEAVRDAVKELCEGIANARERKEIEPDTTCLVAVDSIRKLVPKGLFDELSKATKADAEDKPKSRFSKGPKGIDGANGRAAQIKARLNAAWMDELVPLMWQTRCGIVLIARELEVATQNWYEDDFSVAGGVAVNYDASVRCRVVREKFILDSDKNPLGEKHRVEVRKTKLATREDKIPAGCFHTSNGVSCPEGFDLARDLLEMAVERGILESGGGSYRWGKRQIAKGEENALKKLRDDVALLAELEAAVRESMRPALVGREVGDESSTIREEA